MYGDKFIHQSIELIFLYHSKEKGETALIFKSGKKVCIYEHRQFYELITLGVIKRIQ